MSTRTQYNIATFHDHEAQWLVALFCTKPKLYEDHKSHRYRQDYFFARFRKFAEDYYNFSGDESIYFNTVRKEAAGEANICGGGGRMSGASSRYFKGRYKAIEETREKQIDGFAKKYSVSFDPSKPDPRLFLGVTEIWNKLDRIEDILAASEWADVKDMSYDDQSFVTPFPNKLKKELIPDKMRNKTMQKFRASRLKSTIQVPSRRKDVDEEELEYIATKGVIPLPSLSNVKIFVMPEGLDDDW